MSTASNTPVRSSDESTQLPAVAGRWWSALQRDPATGNPGDRGALARLRRAPTALAALREPATIDLARRLGRRPGDSNLLRIGTVAAVLADVRTDVRARRLGQVLGGADPCMSQLRLRALLNARGEAEILAAFRRAVALAGNTVPVADVAWALLNWDDAGPYAPSTRLAFDYYDAGLAAPTLHPDDKAAEPA